MNCNNRRQNASLLAFSMDSRFRVSSWTNPKLLNMRSKSAELGIKTRSTSGCDWSTHVQSEKKEKQLSRMKVFVMFKTLFKTCLKRV